MAGIENIANIDNIEDTENFEKLNMGQMYADSTRENLSVARAVNPYRDIYQTTLGVDSLIDPVLRNSIAAALDSGECG